MSKLFIASVSVLALSAGAAFAQSLPLPNPGNVSNIFTNGTGNAASIDQAIGSGTSNTSTVYQGYNGNGNPANYSSVDVGQIGGNLSKITSTITQNDSYQKAYVRQDASIGGTQVSNITQTNYGNSASVQQTTPNSGTIQHSNITQSGQNSSASVIQGGQADTSTVVQTGNNSNASAAGYRYTGAAGTVAGGVSVNQGGWTTNTSTVTQHSDYSGVAVTQNGGGGYNWSNVTQTGSGNFAGVIQTAASSNNTSVVSQVGNGNTAGVYQH